MAYRDEMTGSAVLDLPNAGGDGAELDIAGTFDTGHRLAELKGHCRGSQFQAGRITRPHNSSESWGCRRTTSLTTSSAVLGSAERQSGRFW